MSAPGRSAPEIPAPGAGERRSAARGVAWGGVESAASGLVGLLLTPFVVARIGVESLGLWGAAWSLAHTAGLIDMGVGGAYARFTARAISRGDTEELNGTVGVGVGAHIALCALAAGAAALVGPWALERAAGGSARLAEARTVLACTLATVLLRIALSAFRGVVAGAQRLDLLARIGAVAALLEGAGAAALLAAGYGLPAMALNSLAAAAGACAAEAALAYRLCPGLRVRPFLARAAHYRAVLSFGIRLQITRGAEILGTHVPRLALALGPGLLAAGAYELGLRAAGATQILAGLPLRVILPLASRLDARGDQARLRSLIDGATRYVGVLAVPWAAFVLVDAGTILLAWTGVPPPPGAAATARLMALAILLAGLAAPWRLVLRGIGHPGVEAAATSAGSLLNLGLALALAGRFAAPGVALAGLAGSSAAVIILATAARRAGAAGRGPAAAAIASPLAAGAAALLAGCALALPALASASPTAARGAAVTLLAEHGAVMGAVFALAALMTGALRRADVSVLREATLPAGGGRP